MATLTVYGVTDAIVGVQANADAAGFDQFLNTGREQFIIQHTNAGGSAETITFVAQDEAGCPANILHDHVIVLQPNTTFFVAPASLETRRFNIVPSGLTKITYSAGFADLQVAAKRVF
jgi:hypothetical protein